MRSAAAYAEQLAQLLPAGRAWTPEPGTILSWLLAGMAAPLARVDAAAEAVIEQVDPRRAVELLDDWERVAGLPDECSTAAAGSTAERQVAVASRIASVGGQSRAHMAALAASLGYDIAIEEFRPMEAGFEAGAEARGDEWAHTWGVTVRRAGVTRVDLRCVLERAKPAHTTILYQEG